MKSSKAWAFLSVLLLIAIPATATDLSGRVTARGAPLAGAVVTANLIVNRAQASVTVTRTGPNGEYELRGLRSGEYILLVNAKGRRVFQGRLSLTGRNFVKNIELR